MVRRSIGPPQPAGPGTGRWGQGIVTVAEQGGVVYLLATPIGNLQDLSPRARQILSEVSVIACEDTRRTTRLCAALGIRTPRVSLYAQNEARRVPGLLRRLERGESIALVSDAGTPLISDPGFELVRAAHAAGIEVVPIPGPSALMAAVSVSPPKRSRPCHRAW